MFTFTHVVIVHVETEFVFNYLHEGTCLWTIVGNLPNHRIEVLKC